VGYPVPGGNKYRNMTLQVGGVSKIESIKYAHESRELRKAVLVVQQKKEKRKMKTTDPTFHQRGRPTSLNP
jgi:hypothetical protein